MHFILYNTYLLFDITIELFNCETHMLFAFWHHEPEFFEDELQEIVSAIKEGRPYDNCPQLSVNELKQALNNMVADLDEMVIHYFFIVMILL